MSHILAFIEEISWIMKLYCLFEDRLLYIFTGLFIAHVLFCMMSTYMKQSHTSLKRYVAGSLSFPRWLPSCSGTKRQWPSSLAFSYLKNWHAVSYPTFVLKPIDRISIWNMISKPYKFLSSFIIFLCKIFIRSA